MGERRDDPRPDIVESATLCRMSGAAPCPDFRYVGLEPAPASRTVRLRGALAGACAIATGVGVANDLTPTTLGLSVGLGLSVSWLVMRKAAVAPVPQSGDVSYIAIVPWGVLLHSEVQPRVLRWQAVKGIDVRYVEEMDHGAPSIRWSLVTIRTAHETFVGRASGYVALERLQAHLSAYAEESARPIALDLSGTESALSEFEPAFERLVSSVRHLLRSPALAAQLGLLSSGYRNGTACRLSERGTEQLLHWVCEPAEGPTDRRPLLAVIAAELGVHAVSRVLLGLVTSPHPLLAAVARAALLRLGFEVRRVGALDELGDFVPSSELEQIRAWAAG